MVPHGQDVCGTTLPLCSQDKIDVGLSQINEMQGQKSMFEEQLAQSARSASDQKTSFDTQMARATLDASDQQASFDTQMAQATLDASHMKAAYEQGAQLASDDADEMRKISDEVRACMQRAKPGSPWGELSRLFAMHSIPCHVCTPSNKYAPPCACTFICAGELSTLSLSLFPQRSSSASGHVKSSCRICCPPAW